MAVRPTLVAIVRHYPQKVSRSARRVWDNDKHKTPLVGALHSKPPTFEWIQQGSGFPKKSMVGN